MGVVRPVGVVRPETDIGVPAAPRDGRRRSGLSGDLPGPLPALLLMLAPPDEDEEPNASGVAVVGEEDTSPESSEGRWVTLDEAAGKRRRLLWLGLSGGRD